MGTEKGKESKIICVIGAGSSGLTAIKACKEEGLEVECFEKTNRFGGVWYYHNDDSEGEPSVMKSTIINTSKEMSAFSDFPPPKHFANFMHNSNMLKYFAMYAENFDLLKHIRYRHQVVSVDMAEDYEESGRWKVTTTDLDSKETITKVFDGVMICSGHHTFPYSPALPGLDKFQGTVIHTHSLKTAAGFEDKTVLIIGIGNSGVDAAVEISNVSKQLYLSSRRGSWILPRLGPYGTPFDAYALNRVFNWLVEWNFGNVMDTVLELFANLKFDHEWYKLKPKHRVLSAHPTVNDALPNCILSGKVILKQDVDRFTKDGVIFDGEESATNIDAVVLATGYNIKFPFLPESVMQVRDNSVHLYKLVFPPQLTHPTLAFIGLIQPLGAIFPISEAQCRWFVHLIANNLKLPSKMAMEKDIEDRNRRNWERYLYSPRHTIQVTWISYMDEICSQFGAKPNLCRIALTDPKLYWACVWGSCLPYNYRLNGPHSWSGAREAIFTAGERMHAPMYTCKRS